MSLLPAYWILRTRKEDWVVSAGNVLAPLQELGVASVDFKQYPELRSAILSLTFENAVYQFGVTEGQGRGVVEEGEHANVVLLALLALRAQCGGLVIVGEDQQELPRRLRSYMALMGPAWDLSAKIAERCKLLPSSMTTSDVIAHGKYLF
jgi:hypothetical protein